MKILVKILQGIMFASLCCAVIISLLLIGIQPEKDHPLIITMGICVAIMVVYVITSLACRVFPYPWVCDLAGTHFPSIGVSSFDGGSSHSECKKCGKEIMQDSQGNWF